nr:MAG TPA: hypothetical protein [Bacteriophage sp.]
MPKDLENFYLLYEYTNIYSNHPCINSKKDFQ